MCFVNTRVTYSRGYCWVICSVIWKGEEMLKRFQVLLDEWMEFPLKNKAKEQDFNLSFSGIIRVFLYSVVLGKIDMPKSQKEVDTMAYEARKRLEGK